MDFIKSLLHVRLAVLSLNQAAGWISPIGAGEADMLAFVLPRTAPAAAIRLSCAIACRKHDEMVGAGNYHLFRLTTPLEERLSRTLAIYQTLPNMDVANSMAYISELTEGMAIDSQPGPVRTGLFSDLAHHPTDALTCIAKHYLLAHQRGYQTFPYFS